MQADPKIIKKQFKKSLDKYEENAVVQAIMAEKLVEHLPRREFLNILEIGCGSGLLTKRLVKTVNFEKYYANDLVEKSKFYLDRILREYVFLCGNAQRLQTNEKFDLIISNATFQWFSNLEKAIENLGERLKNGGTLAFSTFGPANFREIKAITGLTLDYKSEEDIRAIFGKNFDIKYVEKFDYRMNFANPLEVLAHMKNTGVNAVSAKQWGIKEVKEFCERYRETYPELTLTYSPIIVVASSLS